MFAPSPLKMKRIDALLTSHLKAIREEGTKSIPKAIKDIAVKTRRAFVAYDKYFLYKKDLDDGQEINLIKPKLDGVTMESIFFPISIEEYETMGEKGIDFRKFPNSKPFRFGAGRGTIVFLGIKDGLMIYRSCISTYRNAVYEYIYPEMLHNSTTCYQGFNWTHPDFRKKGLYTWAQTVMFDYMKNHGFNRIVMLEPEDQIGPRKVQDRLGSKMICESFAFRLLFVINYRWNKPNL